MFSLRELLRSPLSWIGLAGVAVGACAPALGDLLDGGAGTLTFVDSASGATIVLDADDCEVDAGERLCPYDATVTGTSGYDGDYGLLLAYGTGGQVALVEATDEGRGTSFEGEMELLPSGLSKGDSERESEGGNVFSVELAEAGGTMDKPAGGTWSGCKTYKYIMGIRATEALATVCAGDGLVGVALVNAGLEFVRTE